MAQTKASRIPNVRPDLKPPPAKPTGKLGSILELLSAKGGATIDQLVEATGWQAHSLRGAMAGALKARGFVIISTKADGPRRYHVLEAKL